MCLGRVVQVRAFCSSTRRAYSLGCVPSVKVRGAIVQLGAYCTQISERRSAWARGSVEEDLRVYAVRQRVKCVATQASKREAACLI